MSQPTPESARAFIFNQVRNWNEQDEAAFFDAYRAVAAQGLTLEYVGAQTLTGEAAWKGMQHMWSTYVNEVKIQLSECLVNGTEVACLMRNLRPASQTLTSGIEIYTFGEGTLHLRVFH